MIDDSVLRGLLLCLLVLPGAAGAVAFALGPRRVHAVRWLSLAAAVVTLLLALLLAWQLFARRQVEESPVAAPGRVPTFKPEFVPGSTAADPHATTWDLVPLGRGTIQFFIGLDGLNVWLVLLTAALMLPSVLVSWEAIRERANEFYAWLLLLQTAMIGIFLAFDIILFYAFFELSLVPLFFLIGIWGGSARRYAAGKFFIYTLTGSLISLLGIIGIVLVCRGETGGKLIFSIPELVQVVQDRVGVEGSALFGAGAVQMWVFLALMAGFAVKVPLVPLHTWLPLAHTEAPTAGSVDLAGVLLKVGAYGFLRLCLPLAPDASLSLGMPLVSALAAVGIVYGAFCAYSQDDIKKLIAYSSVSHLGLVMLGMFALNSVGLHGSLVQMINHGLSTGALFLIIGMLYERYHTRKLADYSGMASRLPVLSAVMVFVCLTSVGLPGLNGFVGEYLVLSGVMARDMNYLAPAYFVVGASGIILGAWYLFTMLRRVFFGPLKEPVVHGEAHEPITDLKPREWMLLAPIAVLCVLIGVYPQPLIDTSRRDVDAIAEIAVRARVRADKAADQARAAAAVAERQPEEEQP
ncbi:MAG TPA: NADH-quinone oxidoreductase subunit M [Gemmataceae bacterium]|nr:NADH-quinone oxidoreductase subunit M [Gemmataceae bacterium]